MDSFFWLGGCSLGDADISRRVDEQREFVQTLDTIGWDRTPSNVVENATSIKLGENKQNWNYAIIIIPNVKIHNS